ncbi:MAG: 4-(cytidine 5'-diphospho)-2-C-methyl-D-erythritol kinase [Limisphaerales bacterium]
MELQSPCKINLLLNILGRRDDGFHALETVMLPVPLHDRIILKPAATGVSLTCTEPSLPVDAGNLVHRAATTFFAASGAAGGVVIHLEKHVPLAAGLGGGSANAAITLRGLNQLCGRPLAPEQLQALAAALGSDVPFFLQDGPALGTSRGEVIEPLPPFPALRGAHLLLVHPGFGIATAWAYRELAKFPEALNGRPGRARELIGRLSAGDLPAAGTALYNSLEAPALRKFPVLVLYQEFLRDCGAAATLMSGSGSTTFALFADAATAEHAAMAFREQFGTVAWLRTVALAGT